MSVARERTRPAPLSALVARVLEAPAALTLAGLVLLSFVVRLALAERVPVPYLLPDEVIYARMAEELRDTGSFAIAGRPPNVLYPVLLAPAWLAGSMETTYELVRALNAALWSLTALPVYFWARRLVAPRFALVAALLTLLMPAAVLTTAIIAENLLLPAFMLACFALAAALERPTILRQLVAFAAIGLAVGARLQAVVLLVVVPLAVVLKVALDARAGRRARDELVRYWTSAVLLAVAAVAYAGLQLAQGRALTGGFGAYAGAVDALSHPREVAHWSVLHLGELVFATAVIPAAALIVMLVRAWQNGPESPPAERAFLAVAAAVVTVGVVPAGAVALGFGYLIERYTFQLLPLLFIAFALWLGRGRPHPPGATALAFGIPAALLLSLRFEAFVETHPANVLTLSALRRLSEHVDGMGEVRLLVAAGLLVACALFVLPSGRVATAAVVVAVAGFLGLASHPLFGYSRAYSRELRASTAGPERTWIDSRIGESAHAAYVYVAPPGDEAASKVLMETGFWNRSVDEVVALEGDPVDVLPRRHATIDRASGRLVSEGRPATRASYAVSRHDIVLVGERLGDVLTLATPLVLYRVEAPLRVAYSTEGVFLDGWTGPTASLTRYEGKQGPVEVSLSRESLGAGPPPAEVKVRLGSTERTVVVPNGSKRVVSLPAPQPPFRLELTVKGTFIPAQYGSPDARELGVQVEFHEVGPHP